MNPSSSRLAILAAGAALALIALPTMVRSAETIVDNTGPTDFHQFEVLGFASVVTSPADSGAGSLRDIIAGIPSGGPPITFDPSLSGGTIILTSGELVIDKDLTIDASALADGITISGDKTGDGRSADDLRIFRIADGGHTVEMNSLTLRGGYGVDLDGAELDNGGGAILHPNGDLTLNHCTLAGNFAQLGGAILHAAGSLTLNHTTIAGNETNDSLVGLGFYGGGGIFIAGGTVALNHCTLSANVTTNTGGGVFLLNGSLTVADMIVAGNTAGSSADIDFQGGSLIASGVNLIGDHTTVESQFPFALPLVGQPGNLALPLLAPLGDYGGPTQTMPPLPGSPVIDAAGAGSGTTDQRGLPRAVDGDGNGSVLADIGAVEYLPLATIVDTADDQDDLPTSGETSLREAVRFASPGVTITFQPSLSGQTITLGGSHILLDKSITIDASAAPGLTINGNNASRVFVIEAAAPAPPPVVTLTRLNITGGQVSGSAIGGGIYNNGTLTLNKSTLSSNSSNNLGGGIFNNTGATLTINQSTLSGNSASQGGGIYNNFATLTLTQSTLSGNSASSQGGGIYTAAGTVTLTRSIVAGNLTGGNITNSGGILNDNSNSLTSGNPLLAPLGDYGGPTRTMPPLPGSPAIDAGGSTTETTDQRGAQRVVDGDGTGGAVVDIGAVEFIPAIVTTNSDNVAMPPSGSLRQVIELPFTSAVTFAPGLSGQTITLGGSQILLNRSVTIDASSLPAGISISGHSDLVDNGTLDAGESRIFQIPAGVSVFLRSLRLINGQVSTTAGDSSAYGGAILNGGQLTLEQCLIANCRAKSGGGIYNILGIVNLTESTLSGNSVTGDGGGIFSALSSVSLTQSTLSGNSASGNGGGILTSFATASLTQSTLSGNSATGNGGGIHNDATVNLTRSIVAGNLTGGDITTVGTGTLNDNGGNLTSEDPLLAPLGDYGGPTLTMPPFPGSPVIDAAGAGSGTTDQRGLPRAVDGDGNGSVLADIGAVEYLPLATIVNTTDDEDDLPTSGGTSLREAVRFASPGATIAFASNLSGQTITLGGRHILLDKDLTLDASALPLGVCISGNANGNGTLDPGESRIFEILAEKTVLLRSLRLIKGQASTTAGDASAHGGAILNGGQLTLDQCLITNCHSKSGGAIYIYNLLATMNLNESTLSDNSATGNGGGIYNAIGTANLTQSTLSGNSASGGGGFYNAIGTANLTQSTLSGNSASQGGGIHNALGTANLTQSTLSGNSASQGGGIHNEANLNLTRSIVAGNLASENISGTFNDLGNNLTSGDPVLAPLGDFGGSTQTMPPLPGSPAIDAGSSATSSFAADQRGLPRVADGNGTGGALVDIGAVEIQGPGDSFGHLIDLWFSNNDGDSTSFGIEFALGTSFGTSDPSAPGNLTPPSFNDSGGVELTFGVNPAAKPFTIWIVKRSPDLSPGSFVEIYRYHGPTNMETLQSGIDAITKTISNSNSTGSATFITVKDLTPPEGSAFYIFEAEPAPPEP